MRKAERAQAQASGSTRAQAGLLDDDPGLRPERHILVEYKALWTQFQDNLPCFDRSALSKLRAANK